MKVAMYLLFSKLAKLTSTINFFYLNVIRPALLLEVPSLRGGQGGVPPLMTACAPRFRFTQNAFSEHPVTTRQQATMEKAIVRFKHNSRSKFSPFFAKLLTTNYCA